jgi:Ca2+-binding RTX toxin-like protein
MWMRRVCGDLPQRTHGHLSPDPFAARPHEGRHHPMAVDPPTGQQETSFRGTHMATIFGTINNDSLTNGTNGNDTFITSLGSDYVQATAGNDTFNLGFPKSASYWKNSFNDFDTVDYRYAWSSYGFAAATDVKIVVDLALGTIQKLNGAGALLHTDTVIGIDSVYGTSASDTMYGRNFWDYEEFRGFGGNDFIDGRGGTDGVNYANAASSGISVNLAAGTVTSSDPDVGNDTLRQIELVTGTNFADTFVATGYGGSSINRNSSGDEFNLFNPLSGNDTIVGNGRTILNYATSLGGAITFDLSLLAAPNTSANIIVSFADDPSSASGITPGNILASGVNQVRGGNYDDTLLGGGRVNDDGSSSTVSGDASFEAFRGNGGDDFIDGKTGFDRADYRGGNHTQGITVNLAAGTVTGDPLLIGTDTLRGIESIDSTYLDDLYDATGFTLSNAAAPSVNRGDVIATAPAGVTLATTAFNEFRAYAGNDTVIGNGATRVGFSGILVENLSGPSPSVTASFTSATAGTASYGNTDGGYGSVTFSGVISIVGGAGNDSLTGAAGYQALRGDYGNDTLRGGDGNDALFGFNGGAGNALNLSTTFSDNDTLDGGAGNDLLRGDFGNDVLTGGSGADTMEGGTGNDTYSVDNAADVVTELSGAGTDLVNSAITYTLGANVERLTLTGSAAINGTGNTLANIITGNAGNNSLNGGSGNDSLNGGAGNDKLNGSTGIDTMVGGTGNDAYYVDSASDVVTETSTLATEIDTVNSSVTRTLGANTENLVLTGTAAINGTGNTLANKLTGNAAANSLSGGAGHDRLDGAAGNDTMIGGTGNDTYVVNAAGDVVSETSALAIEIDTVESAVTYTLGANLERLTLTGSAAINGTGNTLANTITGNAANNILSGGSGNDTLTGGAGSDRLTGGAGSDFFVLNSKVGSDTFTDFISGTDDVRILQAGIKIGDGDALVEGAVTRAAPGGFSTSAEVVVFSSNLASLTAASAAAAIGSATSAYAVGRTALFAVDNGASSAVYLFTSGGADANVSAGELTLLASLTGTASTAVADYAFGP